MKCNMHANGDCLFQYQYAVSFICLSIPNSEKRRFHERPNIISLSKQGRGIFIFESPTPTPQ